jgi:hypothetical protein
VSEKGIGFITHDEARQALSRFNASHFRLTDREHARYSIPADPRRDDDIRLCCYIEQQRDIQAQLAEAIAMLRDIRECDLAMRVNERIDALLSRIDLGKE